MGSARIWPFLGPAFIAAVAYIDPGNFATNIAGGAKFGYLLLWVVLAANLIAMVVQTQSAKLGIATGKNLPEVCREQFSRRTSIGLWLQAEVVAMSTDVAEVVGAALGLNLLFGIPLFPAALVAGAVAFAILALQQMGFRRLEAVIAGLVGVVVLGFAFEIFESKPDGGEVAKHLFIPGFGGHGERPARHGDHRRDGDAPRDLPALGADPATGGGPRRRRAAQDPALRARRRGDRDGARGGREPLDDDHGRRALPRQRAWPGSTASRAPTTGFDQVVSQNAATIFGIALLASGFASSSVGTMSGQVVMQGFIRRRIPIFLRRAITLAPALVVLAAGLPPTEALVGSQVVLSFGIPFALVPPADRREPARGDGRAREPAVAHGLRGGARRADHRPQRLPARAGLHRLAAAVPRPYGEARRCPALMGFAQEFEAVVESLPDDWTDLDLDLRIADESRYVDAAVLLSQVNAQPYSRADWHWRINVAHRFGHAAAAETVSGVLAKLDREGIGGELRVRDAQEGRAEVVQMWGRPDSSAATSAGAAASS